MNDESRPVGHQVPDHAEAAELTEKDLERVAGGAISFRPLAVDGESTDDKHKGEIELRSLRRP